MNCVSHESTGFGRKFAVISDDLFCGICVRAAFSVGLCAIASAIASSSDTRAFACAAICPHSSNSARPRAVPSLTYCLADFTTLGSDCNGQAAKACHTFTQKCGATSSCNPMDRE